MMNLKNKRKYDNGGKIDPNVIGQGLNLGFNVAASAVDTFGKEQPDRINVNNRTLEGGLRLAGTGASLGMSVAGPLGGAIGGAAGLIIGGASSYLGANKAANDNAENLRNQYYGKDSDTNNFAYEGGSRFAMGGNIGSEYSSSMPTKIKGNTHENGGVPLGNSNNEIEENEVVWKGFVFSNRIPFDNKKKVSFADQATKIMKKYKERAGDTYSSKSMNNELERLKAAHQLVLSQMEEQTYTDDEQSVKDVYEFGGYIVPKNGRYDNFSDPEIKNKLITVAKQRGININKLAKRIYNNNIKYANGGPIVNGVDYSYLLNGTYNGNPNLMDLNTNNNLSSNINIEPSSINPSFMRNDTFNASLNKYNLDNNIKPFVNGRVPITSFLGSHSNESGNNTIGFPDGKNYGNQDSMRNSIANFDQTSSDYGDFSQFNNTSPNANMDYGFISNPLNYNFSNTAPINNDLFPMNPNTNQPDIVNSRGSIGQSGLFSNPLSQNRINKKNNINLGREEAALLASSIAGVDNIIKGLKPETNKLKRVKFERLNLDDIRRLNRLNSDRQSNQFGRSIRGSGRSTGEILSGLSGTNASIARDRMAMDSQSYIQEKQANNQIANQESQLNNQISNQEILNNEQNRALAKSVGNAGLANLGNNFQGYIRDKGLRSQNIKTNEQTMNIINQVFPNFKWGVDPKSDELVLQYINRLQTGK